MAYFGASCDSLELNKKFADKLKLDYPLLSDTDKKVAKTYGILNARGMSDRVTFVMDLEGKIAHIFDKKKDKVKVGEHGKQIATKLKELKLKPAKKKS